MNQFLNRPYQPLIERIEHEATVVNERILKVDHFLNHRIEPQFMLELGQALAERLRTFQPDIILTAEASGIAPALVTALALNVPMLYAKKYAPVVIESPELWRIVPSPTRGGEIRIAISGRYLTAGLRVALVDDFLANGRTALALAELVAEAKAKTVAAGFIIEKRFQNGRKALDELGIPIATLASIARLEAGRVIMS